MVLIGIGIIGACAVGIVIKNCILVSITPYMLSFRCRYAALSCKMGRFLL